ncbi:MAG: acetyl-CoA acetyltransferase [Dehalococcoidia bacterium]
MAESIKDKVAIIGTGCAKFGERWDAGFADLVIEAANEALADAKVELNDIDAGWVASMWQCTGATLALPLKMQFKPVSRIENACASAIDALRNAAFSVAAGVYDLVLVVGVEKLKDMGEGGLPPGGMPSAHTVYEADFTAPGTFALAATRYFSKYGLTPAEGKKMLGMISVKSHHNGARNPKAHLRMEVTLEKAMNAPIIAWPLGLFDCCGVTDGAAAAVICRKEDARKFRDDYALIKGFGLSIGPGMGAVRTDYDYTIWQETVYAAEQAYKDAGIKNPREELSQIEVHDCFTIAELIAVESLGICERGHAKEDIESGAWTQEGEIPVNLSGGLKSFGHPIGASGVREVAEVVRQLQGRADDPSRQLKNPKMGLVHNQGGVPGKFMAGIAIIGLPG